MIGANVIEKLAPFEPSKEAMLYEQEENNAVTCHLCAHQCYIPAGREGICKVRENRSGVLYTLVYDRVISAHSDPIEKKPLFYFLPGSEAFSIATVGCNFHCRYWQTPASITSIAETFLRSTKTQSVIAIKIPSIQELRP